MKCETPAFASVSSRDPAPIQYPTAAERTCSSLSEITRSPESSSVSTQFCTAGSYPPVGPRHDRAVSSSWTPVPDGEAARALGARLRELDYTEETAEKLLGDDAYALEAALAPVEARRLPDDER